MGILISTLRVELKCDKCRCVYKIDYELPRYTPTKIFEFKLLCPNCNIELKDTVELK